MPSPAERLATLARDAGWEVEVRSAMVPKMTFTTEEAPEDSKGKATRTRGEDVEVPVVIVRCRRGAQTVWARWKDGKADAATLTSPLRGLGMTEAKTVLTESHAWPCRWLPAGRGLEICEAHGDRRRTA